MATSPTVLSALMVGEGLASLVVRLGVWHQRLNADKSRSIAVRAWSCGSPTQGVSPLGVVLPEQLVQRLEAIGGPSGLGLAKAGQPIEKECRIHQMGHQYGFVETAGSLAVSTKTLERLVTDRILGGRSLRTSAVKVDKFVPLDGSGGSKQVAVHFKGDVVKERSFDLVIAGDGHSSRVREKLFPSNLGTIVNPAAYWEAIIPRPASVDPHSRVDVWANSYRLRWTPLEDSKLLVSALEPNARGGGLSFQSGSLPTKRFLSAIAPNITCPRADPIFAALHDHHDAPCQVTYTKMHELPLFTQPGVPAVLLGSAAASVWPSFDVEGLLEIEDALELLDVLAAVEDKQELAERLQGLAAARSAKYDTVRKTTEKLFKKITKNVFWHRWESLKRRVFWGNTSLTNEHRQVYEF